MWMGSGCGLTGGQGEGDGPLFGLSLHRGQDFIKETQTFESVLVLH